MDAEDPRPWHAHAVHADAAGGAAACAWQPVARTCHHRLLFVLMAVCPGAPCPGCMAVLRASGHAAGRLLQGTTGWLSRVSGACLQVAIEHLNTLLDTLSQHTPSAPASGLMDAKVPSALSASDAVT